VPVASTSPGTSTASAQQCHPRNTTADPPSIRRLPLRIDGETDDWAGVGPVRERRRTPRGIRPPLSGSLRRVGPEPALSPGSTSRPVAALRTGWGTPRAARIAAARDTVRSPPEDRARDRVSLDVLSTPRGRSEVPGASPGYLVARRRVRTSHRARRRVGARGAACSTGPAAGGRRRAVHRPLHELLDLPVSQSRVDSSGAVRPFGRSRTGRPLAPLLIETTGTDSRDGTSIRAARRLGPSHGGHREGARDGWLDHRGRDSMGTLERRRSIEPCGGWTTGRARANRDVHAPGIGLLAWATTRPDSQPTPWGRRAGAPAARPEECYFWGRGHHATGEGKEIRVSTPEGASYSWNAWEEPITKERTKRSAMRIREAF